MRLQLGKEGEEEVSSIQRGLVVPCVWPWLNQEGEYPQREWAKNRRITCFLHKHLPTLLVLTHTHIYT